MTEKCPYCEKHIEWLLRSLEEKPDEFHRQRIKDGFWGTIKEVHDEEWLMNKVLTDEEAIKLRMPVTIDMESGNAVYGRYWLHGLAEKRDKELKKELKHFWIESGGCSMSWTTPICCELANMTSEEEALEWERENFDIKARREKER